VEGRLAAVHGARSGRGALDLTGIAPAPRGVPQIEVSFDMDTMVRDAEQFAEEDRQRRESGEGIGIDRDKAYVLTKYLDPIDLDGTPGIPEDRLIILKKRFFTR
jgi:hypothetical protein